jgi:recombination protein RecA
MKEKVKEKEKMSTEKEAKLKALQLTLDKLDKTYGRNCYENGDRAIVEVETISSGLRYRFSIRVGGYPRGRVIDEIYGPESSERP